MMMNNRQTPYNLAVLALFGIAFGIPTVASGQLLPNLPLRKLAKPPCETESPAMQMVRREYYGYHPTCWRKFPTGWGCPSPEAPDAAASFAKQKRDRGNVTGGSDDLPLNNDNLPDMPGDRSDPAMDDRANSPFPALPSNGNRSPFDLDASPSNTKPSGEGSPRAPGLDGGLPLDPPNRPAPGAAGTMRRRPATIAANTPALNVPSDSSSRALTSTATIDALPGSVSLPPTLGEVDDSSEVISNKDARATAPKRTGMLAGLFGNNAARRR